MREERLKLGEHCRVLGAGAHKGRAGEEKPVKVTTQDEQTPPRKVWCPRANGGQEKKLSVVSWAKCY